MSVEYPVVHRDVLSLADTRSDHSLLVKAWLGDYLVDMKSPLRLSHCRSMSENYRADMFVKSHTFLHVEEDESGGGKQRVVLLCLPKSPFFQSLAKIMEKVEVADAERHPHHKEIVQSSSVRNRHHMVSFDCESGRLLHFAGFDVNWGEGIEEMRRFEPRPQHSGEYILVFSVSKEEFKVVVVSVREAKVLHEREHTLEELHSKTVDARGNDYVERLYCF